MSGGARGVVAALQHGQSVHVKVALDMMRRGSQSVFIERKALGVSCKVFGIGCVAWVAMLAAPYVAHACRFNAPPAYRISKAYERDQDAAVLIGRVTNAEYIDKEFGGAHPWKARVEIERVLKGSYADGAVEFDRGWGSAACDEGYGLPKVGDKWIVYITRQPAGKFIETYPSDVAYAADPTIRP